MKKFESIIILKGNLSDEEVAKTQQIIENAIKENGEVEKIDVWGKKKLAYPIKKNTEGIYIQFYFFSKEEHAENVELAISNEENIIKHIIVVAD